MNLAQFNIIVNEHGPFSIESTGDSYTFTERLENTQNYGYLATVKREQQIKMHFWGSSDQVQEE